MAWGERTAGLGQAWAGGSVNGAVHTTATEQRLVSRRHDRIDLLSGDVTRHDFDHRHTRILTHRRPAHGLGSPTAQPQAGKARQSRQIRIPDLGAAAYRTRR